MPGLLFLHVAVKKGAGQQTGSSRGTVCTPNVFLQRKLSCFSNGGCPVLVQLGQLELEKGAG